MPEPGLSFIWYLQGDPGRPPTTGGFRIPGPGHRASTMASSDGVAHDGSAAMTGKLTAWPDESASTKQVGDWLDANMPYLMKTYGFIIRGETPPSLLKFTADAAKPARERGRRRLDRSVG